MYVTHDQEEALAISDRIAVMDKGVIQQVQSPESIYSRPFNTFVANFLGHSNRFIGTVLEQIQGATLIRLETGFDIQVSGELKGIGALKLLEEKTGQN